MTNERFQEIQKTAELIRSGYAGIESGTGMIVDRREHPEAVPVAKNTMLGVPEPKDVSASSGDNKDSAESIFPT